MRSSARERDLASWPRSSARDRGRVAAGAAQPYVGTEWVRARPGITYDELNLCDPRRIFAPIFNAAVQMRKSGAAPHVGRADSSRCCGWPAGARIREGGASSHARGCAGAIRLRGTREAAEIAEIAIRALIRLPFRGSRFCRANSTEFGRRDGCAVRWRRRARRCRTTTTSWCRASRSCVKSARISTRASLATRRRRVRCRLLPLRAARRCAR